MKTEMLHRIVQNQGKSGGRDIYYNVRREVNSRK